MQSERESKVSLSSVNSLDLPAPLRPRIPEILTLNDHLHSTFSSTLSMTVLNSWVFCSKVTPLCLDKPRFFYPAKFSPQRFQLASQDSALKVPLSQRCAVLAMKRSQEKD